MFSWGFYSVLVIVLWGVVGLLQKLGANRISPKGLIIWSTVGYGALLPGLVPVAHLGTLGITDVLIGITAGVANGLGAWSIYASMEQGAKASVVVPLTALNPLVTILLAIALLHEHLNPTHWIGVVFALLAGAMLSYETPVNSC